MKIYFKIMFIVLLVLTFLGFALAEEKLTIKPGENEKLTVKPIKCCISGKYEGISKDSPNCPYGPKTEKFTMAIKQTDCGSAVYGEVIESSTGSVKAKFEGTVTPIPRSNCCSLIGKAKGVPGSPDENCVHEVKAKICRSATGKWEVIDGTYTAIAGKCCSGTFSMKQR
ncbi:MAG: hypothetical protein QMD43_07230 [Thermodesulfovibrio sp.]|uniref:hypothetical protein n=1 Tax=unclassified Thermodesulfovibrio TaxID=2645936 RepID=UPI00083B2D9B|nr:MULTISPECIES: hypothetical protein [unclassified Thermodesulfovibrio]MDI1472666.1 hypothetical protein [Thermodesulfovibrio sp. 1176]MDI6714798.1 hypothetical protein [Thermodesulfovibrio sp.]ODA44432.1 hypothetical protein THER_0824 [Thermodesulfovibrio sp. N1]